jgi:ABC-2 family transporter
MTWLTWRQFRIQAWTTLGALALAGVPLAVTGPHLAHVYHTSGLATCSAAGNCASAQTTFLTTVKADSSYPVLYFAGIAILYLTPALVAMFWGAPLIARELEAGTLRLAWTQSVTRTRWLSVKLALVGLAAMLTTGLLSLALTWWSRPIDQADALPGQTPYSGLPNRFIPLIFGARDIAPVGYAAFAFALGVTAGMLVRRAVTAMAVTLAVLATIQIIVPMTLRAQYHTPAHTTTAVTISPDSDFKLRIDGDTMAITVPVNIPGAWVTSVQTIDTAGHPATPRTPHACQDPTATPAACDDAINQLHLRELVSYQPANRYWAFQWYETAGYLTLTLILAGIALRRIRRLRPM